jgi:uncharacterized protein (TIGR02145 family)
MRAWLWTLVVCWTYSGTAQSGFTRSETMTDGRDGHAYRVIEIGGIRWFAENLAYLPTVGDGIWVYGYEGGDVAEAKKTTEYREFGALYDWQTAMRSCPAEWHLASDEEWVRMEGALGVSDARLGEVWQGTDQGNRLKVGGDTGFNVRLAGWRGGRGFNFKGEHANFWTATAVGEKAYERLFSVKRSNVGRDVGDRNAAFSVRCVKTTSLTAFVGGA